MAEELGSTNPNNINAQRYLNNKDSQVDGQNDEDLIEEIADFIMATTAQFNNPGLASSMEEVANNLIKDKSILAQGGGEAPPEELPPGSGVPIAPEFGGGPGPGLPPGPPLGNIPPGLV